MLRRTWHTILMLALFCPALAQAQPDSELQHRLDIAREEVGAPGAVLLVEMPDGTVYSAASGLSNIADATNTTVTDRFRIGSITKTFVAVLALKLMSAGEFSLEDKVVDYIPELPHLLPKVPQAGAITVRDLLQHSSGLVDYVDVLLELPPPVQQRAAALPWQPHDIVTIIYKYDPLFEPGAGCDYSSTNFILLGMLIERATEQPIAALIRQHIIDPLGLEDTYFAATESVVGSQARGYVLDYSGLIDATELDRPDVAWATGSILSDADDLLAYSKALFEGDLLSDSERSLMTGWRSMYEGEEYGLGLSRYTRSYGQALGHGGATLAYRAQMLYIPEHDIHVIAFDNLGGSDLRIIVEAATDWALQKLASRTEKVPAAAAQQSRN